MFVTKFLPCAVLSCLAIGAIPLLAACSYPPAVSSTTTTVTATKTLPPPPPVVTSTETIQRDAAVQPRPSHFARRDRDRAYDEEDVTDEYIYPPRVVTTTKRTTSTVTQAQ